MEELSIPLVKCENINGIQVNDLDRSFLYGLLTIKVDPQETTNEVIDFFSKKYPLIDLSFEELIKLREIICDLFSKLEIVSELKREFSAYDDYLARYDTYLTIFTQEIESRKKSININRNK